MCITRTLEALKKNNYIATYFDTAEEATAYLSKHIRGSLVGLGDSQTLYNMGVYEELSKYNKVYDPQHPEPNDTFMDTARRSFQTEYYILSANAMTETGIILNMDGSGNRVGQSLFGHRKVIFVIGENKIVPTVEDAIDRIHNIAAPMNTKRKGFKTPCAVTGHCMDCSSPDRICNVLAIHYKKMRNTKESEVIIIGESLGF